jgi:hypothetical protein
MTVTGELACRSLSGNLYLVKIKDRANMDSLFHFVMIPDCLRVNFVTQKSKLTPTIVYTQISV